MRKENRVKRNEEFQQIIGKKVFVSNASFVVYYQPGATDHFRAGLSVGKKIGNAVKRNKIKRQLRMMLMEMIDMRSPIDVIIIVRRRFLDQTYGKNKKDLLLTLKKIRMNENDILNCKENIDEII